MLELWSQGVVSILVWISFRLFRVCFPVFLTVESGILKITGLRVVDLISGVEKDMDAFCDVFIY
jgi:hypothetical protein